MFLAKSNVLLLPLTVRPLLRLPISIWLVVDRVFSGRGYLAVPELPELLATLFVSIRGFPFMVDLFENLLTNFKSWINRFWIVAKWQCIFLSEVATATAAIVVDNLWCFVADGSFLSGLYWACLLQRVISWNFLLVFMRRKGWTEIKIRNPPSNECHSKDDHFNGN